MYKKFFGFAERPFQLVPNPAYLYLSKSHEEALAHLTYAISQGDGFVEITGEIGTGKTTLCRVFLESLSENSEAAYIFNPRLDAIQLLKAINDDLNIDSSKGTIKELIDELNLFLLKKKSENKIVLLIIDEAQNLAPEVLEQLRLLSNLETSTSKLIQIILVGQPELKDKLDSYELRQLGQRITLSCSLKPLTFSETRDYINHRIHIATGRPGIRFSKAALKGVYSYSKGIPRLINIICDRTLLTAYAMEKTGINGKIVRLAASELKESRKKETNKFLHLSAVSFGLLLMFIAGWFTVAEYGLSQIEKNQKNLAEIPFEAPETVGEAPVESETGTAIAADTTGPLNQNVSLLDVLDDVFIDKSRIMALSSVFKLWQLDWGLNEDADLIDDDFIFFKLGTRQHGMAVYKSEEDINFLLRLNLPSILEFEIPGYTRSLYLVLTGYEDGNIELSANDGKTVTMREDQIDIYWTGISYIPWKNFSGCRGTIPQNAPDESVLILKMLMQGIGYEDLEINSVYDETTEAAVRDLQERNGIEVDGSVGSLTKMVLYNETETSGIPHLRKRTEIL